VFAVVVVMGKVWRTPKRVDRLERAMVPTARGVWALLKLHIDEHNGETTPEIAEAYKELSDVVFGGIVSQKEGR